MSKKTYTFTTANMGDATITVTGINRDGSADISVECGSLYSDFDDLDCGDPIIDLLEKNGVEFASADSRRFNECYITEVMIDRDISADEFTATWGN